MTPHEAISDALRKAREAGRTGLIPFITAGYPDPNTFIDTMRQLAQASDVIEVGVPFSDPMADGMTIQRSSFAAIKNGVTLEWIFDQLDSADGAIGVPIVLMSYLNPLLAFGFPELVSRAKRAGVCGFIVPDMPFEESTEFREALETDGLGLIQLIAPTTPADRRKKLAQASRGFVYAVTITGITGGDSSLPADLTEYLDAIGADATIPVCAGFGIRTAADVKRIGKHADGAIVGSALVEVLEKGGDAKLFLQGLLS